MTPETVLRYRAPSKAADGAVRFAITEGRERSGVFFDGYAEYGAASARALLSVANVATTRFYEPAALIAARILAADPVVTAEPDRLRFESFSACAGAHARFDLLEDGVDVRSCEPGTTNVDFNEPMRDALARVVRRDPLRLTVGWDSLEVKTLEAAVVERRVPLPERWIKGFGEVQIAIAGSKPVLELGRVAMQRFLRGLPGGRAGRVSCWALQSGDAVRILHGWQPGAVCLAGTTRLRVLEPLARYASGLAAFGDPDAREPSTVAWVLGLPGGRVTLTLSPDPTRGFSGEGGLLLDLVSDRARLDAVEVEHAVASRTRFSLERVEADASLPRERAIPALSWLGVHGHVGFDVAEGAFFWRHLPYPDEVLATAPPRLRDATALAAAGAVESVDDGEWRVRSGDSEYRAALDGDKFLCTCPWVARNGTSRGPCKHVLAGAIARARASDRVQVSADPP